MNVPSSLKYTEDHEWAKVEGSTVTVGITHHAQDSLGDVVYVELPEKGRNLTKGETFGVVESTKAVSDLYSPLDGEVLEVNSSLVDDPSQINKDSYEGGWIIKIKLSNESQLSDLLDSAAYQKHIENL